MIHRVGLFLASLAAAGVLVVALSLAGFAPGGGAASGIVDDGRTGPCGRERPDRPAGPGRHHLPGRPGEAGDGHGPQGGPGLDTRRGWRATRTKGATTDGRSPSGPARPSLARRPVAVPVRPSPPGRPAAARPPRPEPTATTRPEPRAAHGRVHRTRVPERDRHGPAAERRPVRRRRSRRRDDRDRRRAAAGEARHPLRAAQAGPDGTAPGGCRGGTRSPRHGSWS